jgi:hypothetical protein
MGSAAKIPAARLRAIYLTLSTSLIIVCTILSNPLARIVSLGDDGLFFVRYAHNFLASHRFSWISGAPPSFGATSQLYQLLTTGVQLLVRESEPMSVVILSGLGGILTVIVLTLGLWRELRSRIVTQLLDTAENERSAKMEMFFGVALIALNPKFYSQWTTGLETTWSTFVVALFVVALPILVASRGGLAVGLPVIILLMFWQRPDLGLIGSTPIIMGSLFNQSGRRKQFILSGCVTFFLLSVTMIGWEYYYNSPVPLPSIVKTALSGYSRTIDSFYAYGNVIELRLFAVENVVALLFSLSLFLTRGSSSQQRTSMTDASLGVGVVVFALFETFGNKYPITSGSARFFMPALPVIFYLAVKGYGATMQLLKERLSKKLWYRFGVACTLAVCIMQTPFLIRGVLYPGFKQAHLDFIDSRSALIAQARQQNKWNQMLPILTDQSFDHCSIADSELGAIGLLPPSRVVYDLSGLNNTDIVVSHEAPAHYILRKRPDYIWYKRVDFYWGISLETNPDFERVYDFDSRTGVAARIGSGCPSVVETR